MAGLEGRMTRRAALALLSITAGGGTLVSQRSFAQATGSDGGLLLPGSDVCVITPETTAGPFYFDPALERRDITDGKRGLPTRVRLQVVDTRCAPLARARVDLWHCDALGLYSGYPGQGDDRRTDTSSQAFLRGTQFADGNGVVEFATIYPGWYPGRTPHMHFKVIVEDRDVLSGQIFFPDPVSRQVYAEASPYNERGREPDTLNGNDGIARRAGEASVARVEALAESYLATMIIGVGPRGA